jgi:lysophospholipase L1-like esterase
LIGPSSRAYAPIWLFVCLLLGACSQPIPQLPPLAQDARLLAFGDSLTYGSGAASGQSYPDRLAALSGRSVINAGKPGEDSAQGLARLPGLLDRHRPQLLLLCHGGVDLLRKRPPAAIAVNLEQMVRLSHERGIPVVLLGVPRPALLGLESAALYRRLGEALQLPLEAEVIAEVLSDPDLKSDQIHPNAEGYRRMAEAVYRLLQRAGALPETGDG